MKHKSARATDISSAVKKIVWKRDHEACILCGDTHAMPNAHFISRAHGGLGIEQNIVTLCQPCHYRYDHTIDREILHDRIKAYLKSKYPLINFNDIVFKKGNQ